MTAAATTSSPAAAAADEIPATPAKRRDWLPVLLGTLVFAGLSVAAAVTSEGFLEADACTHYQYARFALAEPHYLVNVWGRPFVTALYAIPATLAGRIGVRITSLVCALLIATVAWQVARDQKYRWPALAFIFTVAQPLLFLHSFSELTELPFALLLALAFWAYRRKEWLVMAILIALTPTARPEGFGFLMLAAFALVVHRRPWWVLVLPIPLLVWAYMGWRLYGQPAYSDAISQRLPESLRWLMWLRHEWPYQPESLYASGRLWHFVGLLPAVVSPLLTPFVLLGIRQSIRRLWPRDHEERCQVLITAIPLMILVGHSVLYWLGKMASNGELRYMLVVAPFWGLLAARGWEWTCARLDWRHVYIPAAIVALLPIAANAYYQVIPLGLTADSYKARAVAEWYRQTRASIDYPRILSSNPEVAYFMGVSHTDGGWMREWRRDIIKKAQPGTLLVWDPIYGVYNSDANRVISLEEIEAAGWVELTDVAEAFNEMDRGWGNEWRFFASPITIFGHPSR